MMQQEATSSHLPPQAHRLLIIMAMGWIVWIFAPASLASSPVALTVTVLLLVANAGWIFHHLFKHKCVLVGHNLLQLGLFCALFLQISLVGGGQHYRFDRAPQLIDWIEFTFAHFLRAVDLLDFIEEYGIDLQNIRHQSNLVGGILVLLHLTVGLFLLTWMVRWLIRGWRALIQWYAIGDDPQEQLIYQQNLTRSMAQWLATVKNVGIILCLMLIVACGYAQGWAFLDWFLWPLDNVLRIVDAGDAMHLFGWRLHHVDMGFGTITLAVLFRLVVGLYLIEWLNLAVLRFFGSKILATVEDLSERLTSENPAIRLEAARVLGDLGPAAEEARLPLIIALTDPDEAVRQQSETALGQIDPQWLDDPEATNAIPHLTLTLSHPDRGARLAAVIILGRLGPKADPAVKPLLCALKDDSWAIRKAAAIALSEIGHAAVKAIPWLVRALKDDSLQETALQALERFGPMAKKAVPHLVIAMVNPDPVLRQIARTALEAIEPKWKRHPSMKKVVPIVTELLQSRDVRIQMAAVEVLASLGSVAKVALPSFIPLLSSRDVILQRTTEQALVSFGKDAIPYLIGGLKSKDPRARKAVIEGLGRYDTAARTAVPHLILSLLDADPEVQRTTELVLSCIQSDWANDPHPEVLRHLGKALTSHNTRKRARAAEVLGRFGTAATAMAPTLIQTLSDPQKSVCAAAARALAGMAPPVDLALPELSRCLKDECTKVRCAAIFAISRLGNSAMATVPLLIAMLTQENEQVVRSVLKALNQMSSNWKGHPSLRGIVPVLIRAYVGPNGTSKTVAEKVLFNISSQWELFPSSKNAIPDVVRAMVQEESHELARALVDRIDPDWRRGEHVDEVIDRLTEAIDGTDFSRRKAVEILGELYGYSFRTVPLLKDALEHPDWITRRAAANALGELGPEAIDAIPSLVRALGGSSCSVTAAVEIALPKISPQWQSSPEIAEVVIELIDVMTCGDINQQLSALDTIAKLGPMALMALPTVEKMCNHSSVLIHRSAEKAFKVLRKYEVSHTLSEIDIGFLSEPCTSQEG